MIIIQSCCSSEEIFVLKVNSTRLQKKGNTQKEGRDRKGREGILLRLPYNHVVALTMKQLNQFDSYEWDRTFFVRTDRHVCVNSSRLQQLVWACWFDAIFRVHIFDGAQDIFFLCFSQNRNLEKSLVFSVRIVYTTLMISDPKQIRWAREECWNGSGSCLLSFTVA